jgi:hypothetical protein
LFLCFWWVWLTLSIHCCLLFSFTTQIRKLKAIISRCSLTWGYECTWVSLLISEGSYGISLWRKSCRWVIFSADLTAHHWLPIN